MLMRRPGIAVTYMIFDVMSLGGDDLTRAPYSERRAQLEALDLLEPSPSSASTCSTNAASTVSSIAASFTTPASSSG
jgi:ATP-dependent DNA ligase